MTGPEHYREAERLLAMNDVARELPHADIAMIQRAALVHAALALAAATALRAAQDMDVNDCDAWERAVSSAYANEEAS